LCDPLARGAAVAAGLIGALAIWVSPEALVFVAPSLAVLGLCWLQGDARMAGKVRRYLAALTLGLGVGLFLERGPAELAAIENDRISLVHLALFGALTLCWMLIVRASRRLVPSLWGERLARVEQQAPAFSAAPGRAQWSGIVVRSALAIVGALGVAAAMLLLFPHLRDGPLGEVDPLYARVRLHRILEIQPLLSPRWLAEGEVGMAIHRVVRFIGIAIPAVPFLLVLLVRERGATRRIWGCVALVLGIVLGLTFYQVRWAIYAQVLLVLPYSALIGWLLGRVAKRVGARSAPLFRAPLIAVSLFWPLILSQLLPQANIQIAGEGCPISRLAPALDRALAGKSGTILAFADFGPEILYRTGLSVLSIPNHRLQPGFTATYRALTARDDRTARAILADHRVDWILLCPSPVERSVFEPEDGGHGHLYERLADGPVPPWVRPLPLPDDLAKSARLFEVVPEPALVGRGHDAASRS
ncbi:MAG: hypothetical protein ACREH6_00820, partial [Geminicoccaceae bacterium]